MKTRTDFFKEQIDEINRYKWIESEKAGRDLGDSAVREWILKYAAAFRQQWEEENGNTDK